MVSWVFDMKTVYLQFPGFIQIKKERVMSRGFICAVGAALFFCNIAYAQEPKMKLKKESSSLFNSEQAIAETGSIFETSRYCISKYAADSISNDVNLSISKQLGEIKMGVNYYNHPEYKEALSERDRIFEDLEVCKKNAIEKINGVAKQYLSNLSRVSLRELGLDYIIQAQNLLRAARDTNASNVEFRKLDSMKSKIELEVSLKK